MMTGFGQFGALEMGGMFTVMKVREGLSAGDYKDPGPYKNPEGTVAYEFKGKFASEPGRASGALDPDQTPVDVRVVKPGTKPARGGSHGGHE